MKLRILNIEANLKNPWRKKPHECVMRPLAIRQQPSVLMPPSYLSMREAHKVDGQFTLVLMGCSCGKRGVEVVPGYWEPAEVLGTAAPLPDGDKIIAAIMAKKP